MLTIRDALAMPVFAQAKVVAGHAGLDNPINWVHVVDIPDAHYEWKRAGVLLLTAGYGLRDDPQRQAAVVPKLVEQGFAGMVLSVGHYFEATPEIIKQEAQALKFPVIETPPDLLFIEVSEAILEQIINRQFRLLQESTKIHQNLTGLVLQGGDLGHLASTLAGFLQRSITIEDSTFHVLAAAQCGPLDEARERSLSSGRTTPKIAQRLLDDGIYDRLLNDMAPLRVPPMPDLGMQKERIVAPIIVDREIYGFMWIIAGDHALTELDEMAIARGATVAALIMFKEQAVRRAEEKLRGDFFEQLLEGRATTSSFLEQARRFDLRPDGPHQILVIHALPRAGGNLHYLFREVESWLRGAGRRALIVRRGSELVLLIESEDPSAGKGMAKELVAEISHPACRLLVGVGGLFQKSDGQAARRSYDGAREAIQVSTAMGQQEGVVAFDELGMLHWLYHLPPHLRDENAYLNQLDKLAAYDASHNTELVKTLEGYLDHGGALLETAEALFIHRNTVIHRLQRIQRVCGVDLRDPLERLNLHIAVKAARLHGDK